MMGRSSSETPTATAYGTPARCYSTTMIIPAHTRQVTPLLDLVLLRPSALLFHLTSTWSSWTRTTRESGLARHSQGSTAQQATQSCTIQTETDCTTQLMLSRSVQLHRQAYSSPRQQ